MNNIFTDYLLKNGWIKDNHMSYVLEKDNSLNLFFDTSNQIELYKSGKRISCKYLSDIDSLKEFLRDNEILENL